LILDISHSLAYFYIMTRCVYKLEKYVPTNVKAYKSWYFLVNATIKNDRKEYKVVARLLVSFQFKISLQ